MKLTQEELKQYLHYDPDTGIFTWKARRSNVKKRSIAGTLTPRGYSKIKFKGRGWAAHRLAWLYMEGYFPEYCVDHINRDTADNRWENLREASFMCNTRNQKVNKHNKSGISGVSWHTLIKKWQVNISKQGKKTYLGCYANLDDAVMARWKAEVEHGWPTCNTISSAYLYLKERNLL